LPGNTIERVVVTVVDQGQFVIAHHCGNGAVANFRDNLFRLRTIADTIPKAENRVDGKPVNIGQNSLECLEIAMDVGNKRYLFHPGPSWRTLWIVILPQKYLLIKLSAKSG